MPPAIYTQNVIALIWDFDKTLTHGYMQDPLFAKYYVKAKTFWDEVNGLTEYFARSGYKVAQDTVYLNHILTYVRAGIFKDLTIRDLTELGTHLALAPGIPDFAHPMRSLIAEDGRLREA